MANTPLASSDVQPLIEGYQNIDPRLYDILSRLSMSLSDVQATIFPPEARVPLPPTAEIIPVAPLNFRYSTTKRNLILDWDDTPYAQYFELRVGTSWDTAQFITRTLSLEVRLDPIIIGTTRYLIKSLNATGAYSANFSYVDVIIGPIGFITINGRVIDNNVLLGWSEPSSVWDIDYYTISKGANVIGIQRGTFIAVFESASGTFTYSIYPTDLAGNIGPTSSVTLVVSQPPDFELIDFRKSMLPGLKQNALVYGSPIIGWVNDDFFGWDANLLGMNWTWDAGNTGKILVCIDLAETWSLHYTSRTWNTIQDQLNAGYPIYIQDTLLTAKYQEIVDYGAVINNTLFSMNYTLDQLVTNGLVSEIPGVEGSTDRVTWSPIIHAKSVFLSTFRYVRVTIDFTANNDKALALFYNLTFSLDIKNDLDSGNIQALASDVGGTIVYFNKPFKDVDSITLTASKSVEPLTLIYDFVDIPNPTYFKVLVFNSSGVRTDAAVSWKARGIV